MSLKDWKISSRSASLMIFFDAPFIPAVALGIESTLSIELRYVLGPWLALSLVRWILLVIHFRRGLGNADRWRGAGPERAAEFLAKASVELNRAPIRSGVHFGVGWWLSVMLTGASVWFVLPDQAPIGVGELFALECLGFGALCGGMSFAIAILGMVLRDDRVAASRARAEFGIDPGIAPNSLAHQLVLFLACFVIASASLIAAPSWSNHVAFERYDDVTTLGLALRSERERVEEGLEPAQARIVEAGARPEVRVIAAVDELPPFEAEVVLDRRSGALSMAEELSDGRWLVLEGEVSYTDGSYGFALALFVLVILLWAPLTIGLLVRALVDPLRALDQFMRRLIEVGDIRALDHLPVIQYDEIGMLTRCVNGLVDSLFELTEAAEAVSKGELGVEVERQGDLTTAFLAMVEQLSGIVAQIRATAIDVASVSAEIYAATQRQQEAAEHSANTVHAATVTVRSLAEAAERITTSADEVLDNAEHSSETADAMAAKIDALTAHAGGISDLLQEIRAIADRSDLLALNGSLEATRAGEAGRGFALVAAEMRRLAERVTATVSDVRARIVEIETSGASTKVATDATRQLSTQTASAAREISVLTRQQRDETETASEAIEAMAQFVMAGSATTSQTREAAGSLRHRVDELERLVRQFNIRDEDSGSRRRG